MQYQNGRKNLTNHAKSNLECSHAFIQPVKKKCIPQSPLFGILICVYENIYDGPRAIEQTEQKKLEMNLFILVWENELIFFLFFFFHFI